MATRYHADALSFPPVTWSFQVRRAHTVDRH